MYLPQSREMSSWAEKLPSRQPAHCHSGGRRIGVLSLVAAFVMSAGGVAHASTSTVDDLAESNDPDAEFDTVADPSQSYIISSLDINGEFVIPSYMSTIVRRDGVDYTVVEQVPLPGTVFHCPEHVQVELWYTSDVGEERSGVFDVIVEDLNRPAVEITYDATSYSSTSSGGVRYFVAPVMVFPDVIVDSVCDANAQLMDVYLNGNPYQIGTPIMDNGIYTIEAIVDDEFGRPTVVSETFQIRDRPSLDAAMIIEHIACNENIDGTLQYNVHLAFGSNEFDPTDVHLSTINLWLLDENFQQVTSEPAQIAAVEVVPTPENCRYHLEFEVILAADAAECPANLMLTGRGVAPGIGDFDFGAYTIAETSSNPELDIANSFVVPWECEPGDPDPEPVPCQWKTEVVNPQATCIGTNSHDSWSCTASYNLQLWVRGDSLAGLADTIAAGQPGCGWGVSCSRSADYMIKVFMEGDCDCTDCEIQITATPTFSATVKLNPQGHAMVSGTMSVSGPSPWCGGATASGTIQINSSNDAWATINGVGPVPVPPQNGVATMAPIAEPPLNCVVPNCSVTVVAQSTGTLDVAASTALFNTYAQANAQFTGSSLGLQITPKVDGDCDDVLHDGIDVVPIGPPGD